MSVTRWSFPLNTKLIRMPASLEMGRLRFTISLARARANHSGVPSPRDGVSRGSHVDGASAFCFYFPPLAYLASSESRGDSDVASSLCALVEFRGNWRTSEGKLRRTSAPKRRDMTTTINPPTCSSKSASPAAAATACRRATCPPSDATLLPRRRCRAIAPPPLPEIGEIDLIRHLRQSVASGTCRSTRISIRSAPAR